MEKMRSYCIKHWQDYKIVDTKEDFIKLLNILEAHGENLDTFANAVINGLPFCRYLEAYPDYREEAQFLLSCHSLLTPDELGQMLTEFMEEEKEGGYYDEEMFKRTYGDCEFSDIMIEKTTDGYIYAGFC